MKNTMAGLVNIMRASQDMEYGQCPFCGSFEIDSNYVDGRKASPSECLNCGAGEIHPYRDTEETLKNYTVFDGWKKENDNPQQ
jgi:hypothetical protein